MPVSKNAALAALDPTVAKSSDIVAPPTALRARHAAFSSQMAEKRKYHGTELRIHLMLEPQNHQLEPAKHH